MMMKSPWKEVPFRKWWERDFARFQPKQVEAEVAVSKYDYVFYGGAAGPGKSYFLRKYPIKFLIKNCWLDKGLRGVRAGLFCEDYPALWDRHISRLPYEFPKELGEYNSQTHEFRLRKEHGGGVIAFRNLDDPSKYMSSEFALEAVDELTKDPRETFDFLRMRLRWTGVDRPKFLGGSNPGGIGHEWVKKLWVSKEFDPELKDIKDQFAFVPAKATDNKYLSQSYYTVLDSLPEKMRKAYRDGNWDTFAGQYFTEWDKDRHVVTPFPIPATWKKFRSYDHGRDNPACCKWYAIDYDGRIWIYRELYVRGLNVDQLAEEIQKKSGAMKDPTSGTWTGGEEYEYSVADPSIFARTGFVDKFGGQTIAETFARYGIMFIPGSNRRIDGWNLMHQYLYWDESKRPKLIYFSTCLDSIRTIPNLIHDDLKPEDVDTDGEDHAGDTDRYLLMSIHERKTQPPKNEVQQKLERMKQEREQTVTPSTLNKFYQGGYYRQNFGK